MSSDKPVKYNGSIVDNSHVSIQYYTVQDNPENGLTWVSRTSPKIKWDGRVDQRFYTIRIRYDGIVHCVHNEHSKLYDNELMFMFSKSLVKCGRLLDGGIIDFNKR